MWQRLNKLHLAVYVASILASVMGYFMPVSINMSFDSMGFILPVIAVAMLGILKFSWLLGILGLVVLVLTSTGKSATGETKETEVQSKETSGSASGAKLESTIFYMCICMTAMGAVGMLIAKGVL